MSSVARDMVEGYEDIAKEIQSFLWKGKPFKSEKIERSNEEIEEFLESIRQQCRTNYESGSYSLGWRD
ncbi:hypothetical protein GJU41_11940 [Bacillus idriensis]|uniref:Uncharacterized protein n=1 Tax=Metabacillus idriensis TaxID=324768 RepID=A0A6I2MBF6_9BACI|nr:hypothetical protein [Metabacillus idriensis]MRX54684.1 hypothetical protein [Metabacillus idriensis]